MKKALLVIMLAVVVGVGYGYIEWTKTMSLAPGGDGEVRVVVQPGESLKSVAAELEDEGIIKSARYFTMLARKTGVDRKIAAGEYVLPKTLDAQETLDVLVGAKVAHRRFTVPEGKTLVEIAAILAKTGVADEKAFLAAARDFSGLEQWRSPKAVNLEGLLFPDTYAYTSDDNAASIVAMMKKRFVAVAEPLWKDRPSSTTLEPHEVIALASIVERETGKVEERPLIAGVFLNRLRIGMRLQSDPTVIFGIKNFNGNLTRRDLETPTPYNTYTNAGITPTPICSPGAKAIEAVLRPADTRALYFVAKGDGSHKFSNTLDEHNEAVRIYQKGR